MTWNTEGEVSKMPAAVIIKNGTYVSAELEAAEEAPAEETEAAAGPEATAEAKQLLNPRPAPQHKYSGILNHNSTKAAGGSYPDCRQASCHPAAVAEAARPLLKLSNAAATSEEAGKPALLGFARSLPNRSS